MEDIESFSKELLKDVVGVIKDSSGLPTEGEDYDYYSNYNGFNTFCNHVGGRLNKMIGKVLQYEEVPVSWREVDRRDRTSTDVIEEQFDNLVEANDILLERVGNLLDKASGKEKEKEKVDVNKQALTDVTIATWNDKTGSGGLEEGASPVVTMWHSNVPRPQGLFKDLIDNSEAPFVPKIREKPNAMVPLPTVFSELKTPCTLQALIDNAKKWAESPERFFHPYEYEINHFQILESQMTLSEPQKYGSLEDTPLIMVNNEADLVDMINELKQGQEIAVDLEAHSYRSFQGFVCLMQVSTRWKDYIVDTLLLRQHLHSLNEVFTDPKIVKVMHGADWDIPWLQRDFGVYVVNLFDTGQASRALGLPKFSLAFLLNYCCGVTAYKQYQVADWRLRPLPEDMIVYAREDTHYLLYIYDRMRNELIRRSNAQSNLIKLVLTNSKHISLKLYIKPVMNEDSYLKLCKKFRRRNLSQPQLYALKKLYEWRHNVARREDESAGYVLPNHMLFKIAEILPKETEGILGCCNPVPVILKQQLQEVHSIITTARNTVTADIPSKRNDTSDHEVAMETSHRTKESKEDDQVAMATGGGPPVPLKACPAINLMVTKTVTPPVISDRYTKIQDTFHKTVNQYVRPLAVPVNTIQTVFKKEFTSTTPQPSMKRPIKEPSPPDVVEKTKFKKPKLDEDLQPPPPPPPPPPPDFKGFDYNTNTFSSVLPEPEGLVPSTKDKKKNNGTRSKVSRKSSQKSGTFKTRNN